MIPRPQRRSCCIERATDRLRSRVSTVSPGCAIERRYVFVGSRSVGAYVQCGAVFKLRSLMTGCRDGRMGVFQVTPLSNSG